MFALGSDTQTNFEGVRLALPFTIFMNSQIKNVSYCIFALGSDTHTNFEGVRLALSFTILMNIQSLKINYIIQIKWLIYDRCIWFQLTC